MTNTEYEVYCQSRQENEYRRRACMLTIDLCKSFDNVPIHYAEQCMDFIKGYFRDRFYPYGENVQSSILDK